MLHEFMDIIHVTATPSEDGRCVERTVLTLDRLAAFIVTYLKDDGSEGIAGYRQKLYLGMFTTYLPLAYNHLFSVVRQFFNEWCSINLSVDALRVDSKGYLKIR